MINLSIGGYFELIWHPLRTYLSVFRFLAKCQDSPFTWKPNSTIWSFMSLVRCKVLPKPGISTMSMVKTFFNVPIFLKITNSTWFTQLMLIFRSCHNKRYLWHDLAPRVDSYLSYSKIMASKTLSLFTFSQKMIWKSWSKWTISKESAWSKQTPMLYGTNLARRAQRDPPFGVPLFSWS